MAAAGAGKKKAQSGRAPSVIAPGIYARLDNSPGVRNEPAGSEAAPNGHADVAPKVTTADGEKLQSASINAIQKFEGKGIVLSGARTFADTGDSEWKYVNVRRLFLFLERSIQEGLSWAVFEPNGEDLWGQVRLEI